MITISKEKKNTLHIASCSFGKDSLATILLALEHGEPLDEAVYCEVMFDKRTSGEVPEHRAFIYETALPRLEQLGVPVRVLRSDMTYLDLFAGRNIRPLPRRPPAVRTATAVGTGRRIDSPGNFVLLC